MASTVEIIINAKDNASGVLKGVAGTIGNIAKVAGAAALAGGAALGAFLASSVKDAMEAENALSQLNAVIKSTGGVAGVSSDEVVALADSLSQVTRFTDEAVMSGASMLLTFTNIGENVFPQATETILDMSQALGQDLQSSAIQLGKALNDPVEGVTALRRVGVQFTDDQEKMIKTLVKAGKLEEAQALILKELQIEFGGSAKAAGETFAGQLDILNNKISNIKEGIGQALMPALLRLSDMFAGMLANPAVLQFIDDFSTGIASLADRLIQLFTSGKAFDLSFITAMFSNWAASIDWATLSTDLANGINNIDWAAVGLEVRTAFINIMNGLNTIISEVNWVALSEALGAAFQGVVAGAFGYISWDALAADFQRGVEYSFGNGVKLDGIWDTIMQPFYAAVGTSKEDFLRIFSDTVATWQLAISSKLEEIRSTFLYKALEWTAALWSGIQAAPTLIGLALSLLGNFIRTKLSELVSIGKTAGQNFGNALLSGIQSAAAKIFALVAQIVATIQKMLSSININIPGVPKVTGGTTGGGTSNGAVGAGAGFASGGIATGSNRGHWELLHGTEGVFTRDQMAMLAPAGSGGVTINLTYAPAFSTASANELENQLMPLIIKGVRQAGKY